MKLTERIFRLRLWALMLIFWIGFWAPFERMHGATPESTWLYLTGFLAHTRVLPMAYSSMVVMGVAILLMLVAALLRTWASAYLGPRTVWRRGLYGDRIVADGPYRYLRNPLYAGLWLHTLALSILMPPGGALFAVLGVTVAIIAFVHAEERHLHGKRGEIYAEYVKHVPRFLISFRTSIPAGPDQPSWFMGFLGEIYMWGAAFTYAVFFRRFNVTILQQGVLISLGLAIIVQGFLRPRMAIPPANEA